MQGIPIPPFGDQPNVDISTVIDGETVVYDAANDLWIPGAPSSSGDAFTIFPIWAEENGGIANNAREWSFGNGATGNINIVLPVEADLFALTFDAENGTGDASIHALLDDAIVFTSKQFTNQDFELLTTPITYNVGEGLGFRTNIENGNFSDCRVCAWFRIPSSVLSNAVINDLLDVSAGGITSGQFLQYNGTQYVPVTVDKTTVGLGNVDNTSDADKPISTATQAALDNKANTTDPVSTFTNDVGYITGPDVATFETVTNLTLLAGNILRYVNEAGTNQDVDLSVYLDDTNLSRIVSGTFNNVSGIATFTRDDTSTFDLDLSDLLGGVSDHGGLSGLGDDDHPQYHNDARGDIRYYTKTQLDGGQLDNRYYTEIEIDAQQLAQDNAISQNATDIASVTATANTALQPGDNISELTNDSGYITGAQVALFETLTNLTKVGNDLIYTKEDGTQDVIDLSIYLDDTNLSRLVSGTVDGLTGIATFTRDDSSTFTVDFSAFLGTTQARIVSGSLNGATGDLTLTRDDSSTIIINISNLQLDAGNITSGTFADARIAESNVIQHQAALVLTESQISDLADYLENLVEDLSPELGGDLDVNTRSIVSSDSDRIRLAGNLLINGADQLRSFNIKGTGFNARMSIQGTTTSDNPGIEFTNDGNANRALVRMITRGTTGTALQFYTEPNGGSIQNYMTLEDDGRLTFQSGGSIELGDGDLSFTTGQVNINGAGIRENGGNLQLSNDNVTWVDLNTLVNKLSAGDNVSSLLNDAGYITAADVSANETTTTLQKIGNNLVYTNEDGVVETIDLSIYLDDTNLARLTSGTVNPVTGIATFTRDDSSTFTVDFSGLLDNQNADEVPFTSSTGLTSTNVQDAIDEVNTNIGTEIATALTDVAFVNINNNFNESQTVAKNGISSFEASSLDGSDAAIIFRSTGGAEPLWMIGNHGFTGNLRISRSNGLSSNLELQLNDTLLDVRTKKIVNVVNPTNPQDAATKDYVDGLIAPIPLDGLTDFTDSNNTKSADAHFNVFWNNSSSEYELFREFEQVATRDTALMNQTTTLEEYLSMTVNFPVVGTYRIDFSWTSSINDTNQDMEIQLTEDGSELRLYKLEQKDSGGTGTVVPTTGGGSANTGTNQKNVSSSFVILDITSTGNKTYAMNFRSTSTNDEPTLYNAAMHIRRLKV